MGVHIINSGKTPAFNVKGFIKIAFAKPGQKPNLPKSVEDQLLQQGVGVMQPNGTFKLDTVLADITPTKPEVESIVSGENIIYLFGKITYEDVFKKTHFSRYCMYLLQNRVGFSGCPFGNETDEQQDHK